MQRHQEQRILEDLEKKMVFLVGPRQVGKTWLAKEIGKRFKHATYLSEDHAEDRSVIRDEAWLSETDLLIFDELHKMPHWKNYLKGVYDTKPDHLRILVTGSARLDTFRRGGDALSGRFFVHRLYPFSVAELHGSVLKHPLERLLNRGGFPEPLLAENPADAERWRMQYIDGLIRTDVLDFECIHDLRAMQTLVEMLRSRVGSPVSFSSLAEDLHISPTTVARYVQILEALFIVFRITPYSRSIARSLLKEPKVFFFDSGLVFGHAQRLENTVAICLLKHCAAIEDLDGTPCRLQYLRTKDGKEADFCIVRDDGIEQVIEVKTSEKNLDRGLKYFCGKYDLPGVQLVANLRLERKRGTIAVHRAEKWLEELRM